MTLETAIAIAHSFDEELSVILDDEFAYDYATSTILYGINIPEDGRMCVVKYIKETYDIDLSSKEDYDLFALLHEIGHHFTMDDLEDEDAEEELLMRNLIQMIDDEATANETYFKLPSEMMANDWAFDHFNEYKINLKEGRF